MYSWRLFLCDESFGVWWPIRQQFLHPNRLTRFQIPASNWRKISSSYPTNINLLIAILFSDISACYEIFFSNLNNFCLARSMHCHHVKKNLLYGNKWNKKSKYEKQKHVFKAGSFTAQNICHKNFKSFLMGSQYFSVFQYFYFQIFVTTYIITVIFITLPTLEFRPF